MNPSFAHEDASLARRYALAFLHQRKIVISQEQIDHIISFVRFKYAHRDLFFFIRLQTISADLKKSIILDSFLKQFSVDQLLEPVVQLLAEHRRLALLAQVMLFVVYYYYEMNGIAKCIITSCHELNEQQITVIKQHFERMINKKLLIVHAVDKNLIAGMRISTQTFLYEYSIQRQLRAYRGSQTH
jgi:ATP synthase F1 delta subunit